MVILKVLYSLVPSEYPFNYHLPYPAIPVTHLLQHPESTTDRRSVNLPTMRNLEINTIFPLSKAMLSQKNLSMQTFLKFSKDHAALSS